MEALAIGSFSGLGQASRGVASASAGRFTFIRSSINELMKSCAARALFVVYSRHVAFSFFI